MTMIERADGARASTVETLLQQHAERKLTEAVRLSERADVTRDRHEQRQARAEASVRLDKAKEVVAYLRTRRPRR